MATNKNTKTNNIIKNQTLNEGQYNLLRILEEEYTQGFLALNSAGSHTITVYGGSRISPDDAIYKNVSTICKELGTHGWGIVSGGGPGIMSAAIEGGNAGGSTTISFGINIPSEPKATNPTISVPFTQFSARKYLLRQSDVLLCAPGGIGTLDELMEVLTLRHTGKFPDKPILLLNSSFWSGYISWFKEVLISKYETVDDSVLDLLHVVDDIEDIKKILQF